MASLPIMAPILNLPPEVLSRISIHLTTIELGNMRRSCKHIERLLFDEFAKEFFTKRQFMLEEHSLQALIDISKHPILSKYLTFVIIAAQRINTEAAQEDGYLTGRKDAMTIIWTAQAKDMLVEAFRNLPNIRTVGLRDWSAPGRSRDGETSRWRSYGWSVGLHSAEAEQAGHAASLQRLGQDVSLRFNDVASPCFALILSALAVAGTAPASIEVILRNHSGLEASAFNVLHGRLGQPITRIISQLETLSLTTNLLGSYHGGVDAGFKSSNETLSMIPLQRFLNEASSLRSLRLNLTWRNDWPDDLVRWLSNPNVKDGRDTENSARNLPTYGPPSVDFPHLRRLELGFCRLSPQALLQLFSRYRLDHFALWKVSLTHEPEDIKAHKGAEEVWPEFLESLAKVLEPGSNLRTVLIGDASVSTILRRGANPFRQQVVWLPPGTADEDRHQAETIDKVSFSASYDFDVSHWLLGLKERVYMPRRPGQRPTYESALALGVNEDDDDDSDDDDMSEEDDDDVNEE